jgi:NADPH:quinone reductase-like Zn-dependent oxidoreductase
LEAGLVQRPPSERALGADKSSHPTDKAAYAERVAIGSDVVVEIPEGVSFADAATLPVGALTAGLLLSAIAPPKDGGWVIVYGASSSVGYNAVQLAARRGYKVIAVASAKHEALAKELGAHGFVDYRDDDFDAKVKAIVGRDGLLGAADCIGEATTFSRCASVVKELGDASAPLAVSTTGRPPAGGLPEGVAAVPVTLAFVLDVPDDRKRVAEWSKAMVTLRTMPVRSVKGPVSAETVEEAFRVSQKGVSGEKIVIEWTE